MEDIPTVEHGHDPIECHSSVNDFQRQGLSNDIFKRNHMLEDQGGFNVGAQPYSLRDSMCLNALLSGAFTSCLRCLIDRALHWLSEVVCVVPLRANQNPLVLDIYAHKLT